MTVIDIGCGPGFASYDLAQRTGPEGRVYAVDNSDKYLDHVRANISANGLPQIEAIKADAREVPLDGGMADICFIRWLLCFMEKPKDVIGEAGRLLKPGGKLLIWDYFNYRAARVFPGRPALEKLLGHFYDSAAEEGFGYDIGGYLPRMLTENGFRVEKLHPLQRVARGGELTWEWFYLFSKTYGPLMLSKGRFGEQEWREIVVALDETAADPAAFLFTPPMITIVAAKQGGHDD